MAKQKHDIGYQKRLKAKEQNRRLAAKRRNRGR